jgi:hypothetical protein
MTALLIDINMDAKCSECRKGGATPCGLCLGCVTKAMNPKHRMKSARGLAMQQKFQQFKPQVDR